MSDGRRIPAEALVHLRRRLDTLPSRHPDRAEILRSARELYGVSRATLYRALQQSLRPKALRRADRGKPRKIPAAEMERYCEIVAALKLRTTNRKGRHLSTVQAIRLMEEEHGVEAPERLVQPAPGTLHKTTVNRYLRAWGLDYDRVIRAPAAVRFQARRSNELWQFDMSPSDLKHVKQLLWIEPGRGAPTLMLFRVADDRSGVVYQEHRCVYGEDAESALRFLYNAMAAKPEEDMPFQRIPEAIYMDNGPVTRSRVFQNVMACLGVKVMTHLPAGSDGRRTTARSKGKVERPFRTVKDVHETLYHFHEPQDEAEANLWLRRYLVRDNAQDHRSEPHSRIEDWARHLPEKGYREMCAWDRFCAFAREPERRKVGIDTRITVEGVAYEVDPDLAGEDVVLWWGLFDQELYVEHGDRRYGSGRRPHPAAQIPQAPEDQIRRTGRPGGRAGGAHRPAARGSRRRHRAPAATRHGTGSQGGVRRPGSLPHPGLSRHHHGQTRDRRRDRLGVGEAIGRRPGLDRRAGAGDPGQG